MSVSSSEAQANGFSHDPAVSADGRFVTFTSLATNLVRRDTNGYSDVFVRDRRSARTFRASVSSSERQGNRGSYDAAISANGRYVAFCSYASNLGGNDKLPQGLREYELEPYRDVFVRDLRGGTTRMVSPGSLQTLRDALRTPRGGSCAPSVANDGTVAYVYERTRVPVSDVDRPRHIVVWNAATRRRRQVDTNRTGRSANGDSIGAAISADGRRVAFNSGANNLVVADTNGTWDTFLWERARRGVHRVSLTPNGAQVIGDSIGAADISADGRFVAFLSYARALHPLATDSFADVFVKDRRSGRLVLASATDNDQESAWSILDFALSPEGRFVSFSTEAAHVAPGETSSSSDVFLRAINTGGTSLVSAGADQTPLGSSGADVSTRGGVVAFGSYSPTLVSGDTNEQGDVFVRF